MTVEGRRGRVSGGDRDVAGGLWQAGPPGSRLWDGADKWAFVEEGGGDRSAAPREAVELRWPSELSPAGPRRPGLHTPALVGHRARAAGKGLTVGAAEPPADSAARS